MSNPGADNQYDNLLDAVKAASEKGYTLPFRVEGDKVVDDNSGEEFHAEEIIINEFHRFEGRSDPEDNAIIYLIETKTGFKGILIDAFGAYSNDAITVFLKNVPIDRSETNAVNPDKKCLNCGTVLRGKYCYVCGQKDEDLHEPIWKLFWHGLTDYWHFDSKFVNTIVPLLLKPGFLTKEFIAGRRARYVHPLRLYFFISILFFLVYFSLFSKPGKGRIVINNSVQDSILNESMDDLKVVTFDSFQDSLNRNLSDKTEDNRRKNGANLEFSDSLDSENDSTEKPWAPEFSLKEGRAETVEEYDDSIRNLPPDQRPGWFQRAMDRQTIHLNQRAREEGTTKLFNEILEDLEHNLPKLLFILLPIFALILKLLYIRRNVYFVDHGIFTLYFHAFAFLILFFYLLLNLAFGWLSNPIWYLLILWLYLFLAMKSIYRQSYIKTFFKLFALLFIYTVGMATVAALGFVISIMTA